MSRTGGSPDCLIAVAVALFLAPNALADPVAQILKSNGKVIASAKPGTFDFPGKTGKLLHIGSSSVTARGVELKDVSMLSGRIRATARLLPAKAKKAQVDGLYVDGHVVRARVNRLIPLTASDYLITSQAAVGPKRRIGVVGLRLSFGQSAFGLPAGTQFLVGIPARPQAPKHTAQPASLVVQQQADPLVVLGFGGLASLAKFNPPDLLPAGRSASRPSRSRSATSASRTSTPAPTRSRASTAPGLTMYVYEQLGIHLLHWTGYQIHEGTPVPRWALAPGDLIFFYDEGGVPGHVGIYIGNNQFIHAPHTGDVVKISTLDAHYAGVYDGAVRPY